MYTIWYPFGKRHLVELGAQTRTDTTFPHPHHRHINRRFFMPPPPTGHSHLTENEGAFITWCVFYETSSSSLFLSPLHSTDNGFLTSVRSFDIICRDKGSYVSSYLLLLEKVFDGAVR